MNCFKYSTLACTLTLLTACISPGREINWLPQLPSQHYFVQAYQADADNRQQQSLAAYLSWVRKFYNGTPLQPKGWLAMTNEVAASVPADKQETLRQRITALGQRIAAEWAKDNKIRRLTTRNVVVWANALREAIARNEVNVLVERIAADVNALLNEQLLAAQINDERYYESEFNEFF